jgi:RNA polymerase sigma factor (sigma-70 family)
VLEIENKSIENQADAALLELWANPASKEKAFQEIINTYKQRLYWHIRRMVIEHNDADDLLQETFIKAWRFLDNFRKDSSLYTWLYRIATNNCLTFLENKKKARGRNGELTEYLSEKIEASESFDSNKLEWKLQKAINSLPEKQKVVFNLRYYDEMPYEQMSEVLETSVGALKASYHHAAKKIQEYILNHA